MARRRAQDATCSARQVVLADPALDDTTQRQLDIDELRGRGTGLPAIARERPHHMNVIVVGRKLVRRRRQRRRIVDDLLDRSIEVGIVGRVDPDTADLAARTDRELDRRCERQLVERMSRGQA